MKVIQETVVDKKYLVKGSWQKENYKYSVLVASLMVILWLDGVEASPESSLGYIITSIYPDGLIEQQVYTYRKLFVRVHLFLY